MTIIAPKDRAPWEYKGRPFKSRKRIETLMKEILDLMDENKYQEAMYKAMIFIPKLDYTIMSKIEKQAQRDSEKQNKMKES